MLQVCHMHVDAAWENFSALPREDAGQHAKEL